MSNEPIMEPSPLRLPDGNIPQGSSGFGILWPKPVVEEMRVSDAVYDHRFWPAEWDGRRLVVTGPGVLLRNGQREVLPASADAVSLALTRFRDLFSQVIAASREYDRGRSRDKAEEHWRLSQEMQAAEEAWRKLLNEQETR